MMLYEDKKATWEYCHTRQAEEAVTRAVFFSILAKVNMAKNQNLQLRQKIAIGFEAELLQLNQLNFIPWEFLLSKR